MVKDCLIVPTSTPSQVGIGWDAVDRKIYAMSQCCLKIIHYDYSGPGTSWVCSSCRIDIRPYSPRMDAVRASSIRPTYDAVGTLYNSERVVKFVWWWTGYSEDDIKIEVKVSVE